MIKQNITILFCIAVFSSGLLAFAGAGASKEVIRGLCTSLKSDLDIEHKQSIRALVLLAFSALGNKAIVAQMLDSRHVDTQSLVNGWTAVTIAIAQDQHEILRILLESGCDTSMSDEHRRTPVFIAVRYARRTCLAFLHSFNFDMNATDEEGRTPLMWAVLKTPNGAKKEMIYRLLENEADPNRVDNAGFTALGLAIVHRYESIARVLMRNCVCLRHGGKGLCSCENGHPRSEGSDWTLLAPGETMVPHSLLMLTLEKCLSNEFVRELLDLGVSANEMPEQGMDTPLTIAVRQINIEAVLMLLKYGASVNQYSNTEPAMTPLMYAAQGGNERLVRMLLEKGADMTLRTKAGLSARDYAQTEAIQQVLDADVSAVGFEEEWVEAKVSSSED